MGDPSNKKKDEKQMTQLRCLVAVSILVVCLSGVAVADGGEVQGPPLAPPDSAPQCTATNCAGTEVSVPQQQEQSLLVDIVTEGTTMLDTWLAAAMF
jgi:hypothetical protein